MSRSPALNASAMTSPRTVPGQTSKAMRPFNPNSKYPVKLAERLKEGYGDVGYNTFRLDIDPSIKFASSTADVVIHKDPDNAEGAILVATDKHDGSKQQYRGSVTKPDSLYSLTFDPTSQTLVLDRVDASMTVGADCPASSGSDSSDSESDGYGTPDPDNPYDWRHQLKRRSNSPDPHEDEASVLSGFDSRASSRANSRANSPASLSRPRRASSPSSSVRMGVSMRHDGSQTTAVSTPAHASDEEIEFDRPAGSMAKRGDDVDNDGDFVIVLDGDGPDGNRGRPKAARTAGKPSKPTSLAASLANSRDGSRRPVPSKRSNVRRQYDDDGDDDEEEGDLEIELDNSPPGPARGIRVYDGAGSDIDDDVSDHMDQGTSSLGGGSHVGPESPHSPPLPGSASFTVPAPEPTPEPELALELGPASESQRGLKGTQPSVQSSQVDEMENEMEDEMEEAFERAFNEDEPREDEPTEDEESEVSEAE